MLRNAWTGRRLEPKSALFSDDLVCLLTGSKVNGWLSGADNSLWVLYVSMEGMTSDDVLDKVHVTNVVLCKIFIILTINSLSRLHCYWMSVDHITLTKCLTLAVENI